MKRKRGRLGKEEEGEKERRRKVVEAGGGNNGAEVQKLAGKQKTKLLKEGGTHLRCPCRLHGPFPLLQINALKKKSEEGRLVVRRDMQILGLAIAGG
jgi:hypothetical protein